MLNGIAVGMWVKGIVDGDAVEDLGVGKLVDVRDGRYVVEYFDCPGGAARHQVVHLIVERYEPHRETRVHHQDPRTGNWRAGRLQVETPSGWIVFFPNGVREEVRESDLYIRWNRRIADPIYNLASRVTETPFFHDRRSAFVASAIAQRGWCAGLSGLISSQIELEGHQIEVVRRVLQDPVQRYLLADEVGLGKTVEAGILLRQYFLDDPTTVAVLIVPPQLVAQWRQELVAKFALEPYLDASLFVLSSTDTKTLERVLDVDPDVLIVDEAHHVCAGADQHGEGRRQYGAVEALARKAPRVLLLSATPVLRNERSFLAMLHLLDPEVYSLDGLEAFRARVANRQTLADALGQFSVEQDGVFLEQVLDQLEELFPADDRLRSFCSSLRPLVDEPSDHAERTRLIRFIRMHVSETYRLHRRILRNRRTEDLQGLLPGRDGLKTLVYDDALEKSLEDFFDEWRLGLARHISSERDHGALHAVFAEAIPSPAVFIRMAQARLGRLAVEQIDEVLWPAELEVLRAPLFPGEKELLAETMNAAGELARASVPARLIAITDALTARLEATPATRFVVFADHARAKNDVFNFLARRLGTKRVLMHEPGEEDELQWAGSSDVRVLVCDRRAEEGLNLQGGTTLAVHLGLPFSPNRIEQRLGRLDRFGSGKPVLSLAPLRHSSETPTAWARLLADRFQVFSRSVASLQYVIEDRMRSLMAALVEEGAGVLVVSADAVSGEIERELRSIRSQELLDSMEAPPHAEGDESLADKIDEADDDSSISVAFRGWAVSALGFEELAREDKLFRLRYTERTLIPVTEFLNRFADSVDRDAPGFDPAHPVSSMMSFKRRTAVRSAAGIVRVGQQFYDGLVEQAMTDDRGTCFGLWRTMPGKWIADEFVAFKFTFIVDGNLRPFDQASKSNSPAERMSVRRQLDARFPPLLRCVWIAANGEEVVDAALLRKLNEPYSGDRYRADNGMDYNLNFERWSQIERLYSGSAWYSLCLKLRERAEVIALQGLDVLARSKRAAERASDDLSLAVEQLQTRVAASEGHDERSNIEVARLQGLADVIVSGIRHPSIVLDSVGAVFLSSTDPFGSSRT